MRRHHLFEFEDQPWLPGLVRDGMTDLLGKTIEALRLYEPVAPLLADALRATGDREILDLCSGGGGPLPRLRRALAASQGLDVTARLSDFYPNIAAFERIAADEDGRVGYVPTPVDATRVPPELTGFRTLFTSFHHFRPDAARAILGDAFAQRRGIAVFEFTERSAIGLAQMALTPVTSALLTPFLRPFRWSRLALSYVVPIIPALFIFDGVVSQLRTYTPEELREMTGPLQSREYTWEIGRTSHPIFPSKLTYLLGLPNA
ncbi:MAG: hypothetical protein JNL82_40715 [Myxococcales bacterium]|nr:hypothetical protein [Myxococcales bacterium]